MRRLGDQVTQVNVQLIEAESGAYVSADRFETDRRNLVEAQSEITGRLARTLNLELVQAAGRRIEQERTVDPDAQDLMMRGWALYQRPLNTENRKKALQAFERAQAIDPNSLDAEIGIAAVLAVNVARWLDRYAQKEDGGARREIACRCAPARSKPPANSRRARLASSAAEPPARIANRMAARDRA